MIFLGIGNRLPEHLDLGNTQSPGSLLASQLLGALGGMVGQQSLVLGVADDCLNCAKAPRGDTSSAGRLSATSTSASFGRFPIFHVGLHLLDIGDAQLRDHALAERSEEHKSELQSRMRISYAV